MKQQYGISNSGDLKEAIKDINNPQGIIFVSSEEMFKQHVKELEELFPGVPSIGCVDSGYANLESTEKGVVVIALSEAEVLSNVIENISIMPIKYMQRLIKDLEKIDADYSNTVCFDFATGFDGKVMTTMDMALRKKNISLIGGTAAMDMVSLNGKIYHDSSVYLLIKNKTGKIKTYIENIYAPTDKKYFVTKSIPSKYEVCRLDGKPAKEVYMDALKIKEKDIVNQTFKNPFGRICGNSVFCFSVKDATGEALSCYKQVNDMDVISIMKLGEYDRIITNTINRINKDFNNISGCISINCIFRYFLFKDLNYLDSYLNKMSVLGTHAGIIGFGEHYNCNHVNQSMSCIDFE